MDLDQLASQITAAGQLSPVERIPALRALVEAAQVALSSAADDAVTEALAEGRTYQQLADELGVSMQAIGKAVARRRQALRRD